MFMLMRPESESAALRAFWKNTRRTTAVTIAAAGTVTLFAASPTFVATDLGTLGGDTSYPLAVNDDGVAVGYSNLSGLTVKSCFPVDSGRRDA